MRMARHGWQEDLQERDETITCLWTTASNESSCKMHAIVCAATFSLQRLSHHRALGQFAIRAFLVEIEEFDLCISEWQQRRGLTSV